MGRKKTTCCVCGKEYDVCHFCPDVANFTPWRRICDTSVHYKIYLILSEYDGGVLNKADALEKFKTIGVKADDCKDFRPHIYKIIKDIFAEEKKEQKELPKYHTKKTYKAEKEENITETHTDEKSSDGE